MKKLSLILSILGWFSSAFGQTSGVISYPVNGEVMGGSYASQGIASTLTGGAVIPTFVTATATTTNGSSTIMVASSSGIVHGEKAILVTGSGIQPGSVVSSISGGAITLSLPATASGTVTVTFASVYLNFDGTPGCGSYCSLSITGAGTASASYYAGIYAGLGEWAAGSHTISLTVVDSTGATSTTGNTSVTVYNSSPAGNCSSTLIVGSIYCMEAATAGTIGPTASLMLNGPFQAGDVVHTSQFLLRPASPYTAIAGSLTATQTNVTIAAPPIISGTANTTNTNQVITLDATSYGNVCVTRLGQIITGSTGIAPGTAVIRCLGSNQVLLSQPATATASGTVIAMQFSWPSVTGIAAAAVGSSGGSGYAKGDILNVTQAGASGGQVIVASIGAGGVVTGVATMAATPANFYTASGYSNASNLSTSPVTGSGAGALVNITAGFVATITDQGYGPGYEQWRVTGISGVTWTVVRGFNGTQPIAHLSGAVGVFDPGPYPILPSYMTDTAGNTWTLVQRVQTDFTDNNTVDAAVYYTTFTSGTAAVANAALEDTLTFTHPYAQLGQVDMNAVRYRGLGAIGNTNNPEPTNGYAGPVGQGGPFNNSMTLNRVIPTAAGNAWPVSAGDLCVVTAVGSPFMVINNSPPGPPINALLYALGGSGTVSVSGSTVSLLSGTPFSTAYASVSPSAWQPGAPIVLGGVTYHIASVSTSTTLTTIETPTPSGSETYSVAALGSAPSPGSGWTLRQKDPSRMYNIDAIATGTSCNGGAMVTNVDGMGTIGVAFHPAGGSTTVYGQSARIGSSSGLSNSAIPAISLSNGTASVDFEIDNLNLTTNTNFLALANLGFTFQITQLGGGVYELGGNNIHFSGWDGKGNSGTTCQGNPYGTIISNVSSVAGNLPVYGRYQVDFGAKTDWFELWDGTGNRIFGGYCGWNSVVGSPVNGVYIGSSSYGGLNGADTMQVGFLWQRSNILPLNSKMPTFAHSGSPNCIYDYHFDTSTGNTNDSCTVGPYNLTATGTVTYPNTASAVQSVVRAVPTQIGAVATSIAGWATMNSAVGTQQMDCLAKSVAQYNASDAVTCVWSQTQGPAISFSSTTATQPTISGIVATNTSSNQDYILSLTVADMEFPAVASSAGTIEMGAVPLDSNGVVTNLTGSAGQFFTPLIGYGYNPWGEADTLQYYMIGAQQTYQAAANYYQQWATYPTANGGTGRVTYPFTAKGEGLGIAGTTTTASILATATTIPIADITKISTPFPTWVMLGSIGANNGYEVVRVSGCTSTCPGSGAATLQVAYDGRGLSSNGSAFALLNGTGPGAAAGWPSGTTVGEMRFQGTSTLFSSDAVRPIAPAGVPGPIGQLATSPGTVALFAGSTMLTGTGTGWTAAVVGDSVLITGTTHSSMPFHFWREITGFTDATHVTLDHAAPTGMDSYSGAYQLLTPNIYVDFELPAPQDNHTIRLFQPVFGCESETSCFGIGAHDIPQMDAATISGQKYSWQSGIGTAGSFGPNFYGTGLAARNLYLRSGYYPAYLLANYIDEYWVRGPELGDGYTGGLVLNYAGGVNGAFADFITNPSTVLTSATFEDFGIGYTFSYLLSLPTMGPFSCDVDDSRDTGAAGGFVAQLANWDANTGTGTLSGSLGAYSTGGIITGWTGSGQTPPFIALITLAGSDTNYEIVRVTGISGTTFTWTPAYFPSSSSSHTSGAQLLSGAAMYTFILSKLDIRDQKCRRNASDGYTGSEVNSWAQTSNFGLIYGPLTLTNGSATGTGSGLYPGMCNGKEIGTLSINSGSTSATLLGASVVGQGPAPWQRIYIWDGTTLNSFAYIANNYNTTGATLTLAGAWGGSSCTSSSPCTYMTENTGNFTAIWYQNTDSYTDNEALKKAWACVWNSAASITLNRPWDGPTTTAGVPLFYSNIYPAEGFEQQPFMLGGYKVTGMRWAQHSSNPSVASDYTTISQQAGLWDQTYGWDYTNSKGIFYVAVFQVCNPPTLLFNPALVTNTYITTLHGGDGGNIQGCGAVGSTTPNGGATAIARSQNPEMGSGMIQWFNTNPSSNRSLMDSYYGATFGTGQIYGANTGCATSVASTCDGLDAANCEMSGMNGYKWPGFCFGMGGFFSTSYPALRTLGQSSHNPVPISGHGGISGRFGLAP